MGLSEKLADYIIDTDYEDLPKEVVEFTKLCIIDYFSSAIAGASQYPVQKIDELVKELGGTPRGFFNNRWGNISNACSIIERSGKSHHGAGRYS